MNLRKAVSIALTMGIGFSAGQAQAVFFDSAGDSLVTNYSTTFGGATITATITYALASIGTSSAVFNVTVANTTPVAQPGDNRLVGFAVTVVNPDLASVIDNSSEYTTLINQNFPGGFNNVDFCGSSGPPTNCSGGGSGGVNENQTHSFQVTMNFLTPIPTAGVEFGGPFAIRFQSAGRNKDSITFDSDGGPPVLIPEPSTLALLGLGLLGAGVVRRRALS